MSDRPVLSVPAEYPALTKLRAFVREQALDRGMSGKDAEALALAVDEAATNIISHVTKGLPHIIECACENDVKNDEIICEIFYDADDFFTPDRTPDREEILNRVQSFKRGGLGVYLVHTLVDKVEYRREGDRNVICLIKHI
jgi:serine/threonine-protein kinase RsbW